MSHRIRTALCALLLSCLWAGLASAGPIYRYTVEVEAGDGFAATGFSVESDGLLTGVSQQATLNPTGTPNGLPFTSLTVNPNNQCFDPTCVTKLNAKFYTNFVLPGRDLLSYFELEVVSGEPFAVGDYLLSVTRFISPTTYQIYRGTLVGGRLTIAEVTPVPEPASLALFGLGLAGLGLARRRRAG